MTNWGTGIPVEVTPELMARGQERFTINCQVCHGGTGSGNGVTSKYGLNGIANYHDDKYLKMADGEIFNTITNGHNTMLGYGANVDRARPLGDHHLHPRAATLADRQARRIAARPKRRPWLPLNLDSVSPLSAFSTFAFS